ncbi:hypothetical protein NC653_001879 [Populus alba x Populus x berolinensis]|uniref:Uncharacterized protein n=1 Tax=Populus alba x Populus x berolinensis TaxID=444605 RepID=A0AAD6RM93_9ROSI|nr:hypothetical protein NC653_001879 [Populus alba x Populus x berolinensis]
MHRRKVIAGVGGASGWNCCSEVMHPALLTTATLLEQADVTALLCSEEKSRCCSLLALSLMLKWTGRLLDAEEGAERGCRSLLLN